MGFKPKFKIGDFVEFSQRGKDRYWLYKTNRESRILSVDDYWDGGKKRKEYLVNVYEKVRPDRGQHRWFKSGELELRKVEAPVGVEELI